jgi:hypothetical protein
MNAKDGAVIYDNAADVVPFQIRPLGLETGKYPSVEEPKLSVDEASGKRRSVVLRRHRHRAHRPFSLLEQADLLIWHIGGRRPLFGLAFAMTTQLIGIVRHGLA